ncbi:Oidioi.mRNA.OKI2018_I69.chr1.g78.t1.cds [Oikopleura dioica]|uniref:Oidioi.mRNA.OKI2018_I69.chr1.g78.t1.cds n=1 Tax=Oikopleura dioica TaxID=34765 RepID=A0ABN7SN95_OIKDI|nr:Oidioi.mRNA.OKI2018_I69.chr1.g78.t1.cds [Oikopleura dioica]
MGCEKCVVGKLPQCDLKLVSSCFEEDLKGRELQHISALEHICYDCLNFLQNQDTCYKEWKTRWEQDSLSQGTVKTYLTEKFFPYWIQCIDCRKWRRVQTAHLKEDKIIENDVDEEFLQKYNCDMGHLLFEKKYSKEGAKYSISTLSSRSCEPQEELNPITKELSFINTICYPPLLKFSPAEKLFNGYYPDGVGQSVIDSSRKCELIDNDDEKGTPKKKTPRKIYRNRFFPSRKPRNTNSKNSCFSLRNRRPFYQPGDNPAALTLKPDSFEPDEVAHYQSFPPAAQRLILAVRNLVVSMWSISPTILVTPESCMQNAIIRGYIRAALPELFNLVIEFLTIKGIINFGIFEDIPRPLVLKNIPLEKRETIVVIGAGPSGISTARQLHNFGFNVKILEARKRIGGRVHDVWAPKVAAGAMVINGCQNNPIITMSRQIYHDVHILGSQCDLFVKSESIARGPDLRMEHHFNTILDILSDWRLDKKEDIPLIDAINLAHKEYVSQSAERYSKTEMKLLDFHINNLEYACGASLSSVSALNWDQNERFPQFGGDHAIVTYGFSDVLEELSKPLNIEFEKPVASIDHSGEKVVVETIHGEKIEADRCVVTIPLALMKKKTIKFTPDLSPRKWRAVENIGAGLIEKCLLRFDSKWWSYKIGGADFFGSISVSGSDSGVDADDEHDTSGIFNVFYDIPSPESDHFTLMSIAAGASLDIYHSMSDKQLVSSAMATLQEIFKEITVPEPLSFHITRWGKEEYSQMSYSFIKLGSTGKDYDEMAEPASDRLFFAGEATNRHFPQTVTGAYLSGVREAARIFKLEHKKLNPDSKFYGDSIFEQTSLLPQKRKSESIHQKPPSKKIERRKSEPIPTM